MRCGAEIAGRPFEDSSQLVPAERFPLILAIGGNLRK